MWTLVSLSIRATSVMFGEKVAHHIQVCAAATALYTDGDPRVCLWANGRGGTIAAVPIVILAAFVNRQIVARLSSGTAKG